MRLKSTFQKGRKGISRSFFFTKDILNGSKLQICLLNHFFPRQIQYSIKIERRANLF